MKKFFILMAVLMIISAGVAYFEVSKNEVRMLVMIVCIVISLLFFFAAKIEHTIESIGKEVEIELEKKDDEQINC